MTGRSDGAKLLPGVGSARASRVRLARWAGAVARDVEAGLTMRATAWIVDAANEADAEASESIAAVQGELAAVAAERDALVRSATRWCDEAGRLLAVLGAASESIDDGDASATLLDLADRVRSVAEERDRLRAALAEAADELARSWRATAPAGRSRAHARGEGTAEAPGAADGQWGSGAPGGGQ